MARPLNNGDSSEPQLNEPLDVVESKIRERISKGRALKADAGVLNVHAHQQQMYTWNDYNVTLLRKLLGPASEDLYSQPISFGGSSSAEAQLREFREDMDYYLRQLDSIAERLHLWDQPEAASTVAVPPPDLRDPSSGDIFVVHGRNLGRANEVARFLEAVVPNHVVILHEQASRGRTVLEKFEKHATEASFAVVVLTADDEGRQAGGEELVRRGRQNVIFELGFFFGRLGRDRVVVLVDDGVEHPSDVQGLVYVLLDSGGWKLEVMKELASAGIKVNWDKAK